MRATRMGFIAACLMALAAAWLFFAPFIVGYQPRGAHWVTATRNDLAVGGALAVTAVIGLTTAAMLTVRELHYHARTHGDHFADQGSGGF
jgi:hypothetical protein